MTELIQEIRSKKRPALVEWVPATGDDGQVRMEMRWHVPAKQARRRSASQAA